MREKLPQELSPEDVAVYRVFRTHRDRGRADGRANGRHSHAPAEPWRSWLGRATHYWCRGKFVTTGNEAASCPAPLWHYPGRMADSGSGVPSPEPPRSPSGGLAHTPANEHTLLARRLPDGRARRCAFGGNAMGGRGRNVLVFGCMLTAGVPLIQRLSPKGIKKAK